MITTSSLSRRDRSVLVAVAAGRGAVSAGSLLIDGLRCADQFAVARLADAGLLLVQGPGPAQLSPIGQRVLAAA